MKSVRKDLTAKKFEYLTVISYAGNNKERRALWRCICVCGTEVIILGKWLTNGRIKSCGCLRKKLAARLKLSHGMSHSPTYRSWASMLTRCSNQKQQAYRYYGAIGIKVCDHWKHSFENFLADMGERPQGKTLDRIDSFGNYEPQNCRWATPLEQSNNTRGQTAVAILVNGYKSFSPAEAFEDGYSAL